MKGTMTVWGLLGVLAVLMLSLTFAAGCNLLASDQDQALKKQKQKNEELQKQLEEQQEQEARRNKKEEEARQKELEQQVEDLQKKVRTRKTRKALRKTLASPLRAVNLSSPSRSRPRSRRERRQRPTTRRPPLGTGGIPTSIWTRRPRAFTPSKNGSRRTSTSLTPERSPTPSSPW